MSEDVVLEPSRSTIWWPTPFLRWAGPQGERFNLEQLWHSSDGKQDWRIVPDKE